ncbi:E3 ubiquitin-protein ligase E3D [Kickxella alabastrina]|uniref:E3 ubiquitin-protein ligase E3D n=1 Tax=Kickxella alabastrina TaxID=61397 RepID=A0ACC1ILE0_9FUNG|nr:E3 ubiquitin-protein ligase E3D [Kickxella alabastrina]
MPAYYIEVLDNLQVVDIYAESTSPDANGAPRLVAEDRIQIDKDTTVKLPVAVNTRTAVRSQLPPTPTPTPRPVTKSTNPGWVRIRAPIAHASRKERLETTPQLITVIQRPVTSSTIKGFNEICCQACGARLLSDTFKSRGHELSIRDLPSAYWGELVDCWVCHPEEDSLNVNADLLFSFEPDKCESQQQQRQSSDEQSVPTVDVWVGDIYVLVSASLCEDLPTRLVHIDAKERFVNAYTELHCNSCNQVVGETGCMGRRRVNKLYLHRVRIDTPGERVDPTADKHTSTATSVSLSQVCCSEFLGHSGAHAVYKFVVEGRKSCKPAMLIHVVGWNAELQAASGTDYSVADISSFSRCVKVLYTKFGDSNFDDMASQWLADDAAELISLLDEDCISLVEILDRNMLLIPPQLRAMPNMKRSFLHM